MPNTHFPLRPSPLKLGPKYGHQKSYVTWSLMPARKAIVFIHGYGGDALVTWSDFYRMLPDLPEFQGYDFIYYGHDGLYSTITTGATLFYEFMDRVFTEPLTLMQSIARPADFRYERVVIAAHSLGAVLARNALLYGRKKKKSWMDKTSMVLFAPAHMGARIDKLAIEASGGGGLLGSVLRLFVSYRKFQSPLIEELAVGSPELKELLHSTQSALKDNDASYLIAKVIICADQERVVKNLRFGQDPWPPETFAGTSHTSICKPNPTFGFPVDLLKASL